MADRVLNYAQAISETLRQEMEHDSTIVLLGEDIGVQGGNFGITKGFLQQFGPNRVWDTPISEEGIIGISVGAAISGLRPVPEIMFSSFLGCCMDQIYNHAAQIRYMTGGQADVPLVIRTVNVLGRSSAAQHSGRPEAWFAHIPGLFVVTPATPSDAMGLLRTALRGHDPVVFIEHAFLYYKAQEEVPEGDGAIPFGEAVVRREGSDLTIVAYSLMAHKALEAATELAKVQISAEVLDLRTLVPLDVHSILKSVAKTHRLVVVTEASKRGSFAGEIAAVVAEEGLDYLDAPIARVAALDVPVPFSPSLENYMRPEAEHIVRASRQVLEGVPVGR